jgi:hypothetical protein
MSLATWWYQDARPKLPPIHGLEVRPLEDNLMLAALAGLTPDEVAQRRAGGHRPYVGYLTGLPIAYGWVASRRASIGELNLEFGLPAGSRYLWDFATLPAFRGLGVYPHMLNAIVERESPPATRLWIIHAPENLPSGLGIARAGFEVVAELSFDADRRPALAVAGNPDRAAAGAALLGLPLAARELAPCWRCGSVGCEQNADGECACALQPSR